MQNTEPALASCEQKTLYGLRRPSNDKAQRHDIPELCAQLCKSSGSKRVLPLYILSREYNPKSGYFTLFVGTENPTDGLEKEILPAGLYAEIEVRPLLGLFWGTAIGRAKRWFYTVWLPKSEFIPRGFEYELHTEKSIGCCGSISLLFAVERKA